MNQFRKIFFIIVSSIGILLSQNVELITQKINVENAIRDKVNVTINKLLDQSQYVIIVNARMDLKGFSMLDNKDSEVQEDATKSYYSPIPGLLPTVPQNIKQPTGKTYNYSTDKYLLYFADKLKARIGQGHSSLVEFDLVKVEKVQVLHVQVQRSEISCFLDNKDYYVRQGPRSDKLEGPDLEKHLRNRNSG